MKRNAYRDLRERGFVYQATGEEATEKLLNERSVSFYVGFDPTADSLHVGHLLPIMAMRRMQEAGHRPIALVGGATALVGDPSGKQEARPILSKDDVASNVAALRAQLSRFIHTDQAEFVNNADWFEDMGYLDFLRDVGYHFSVNRMLAAESVKSRLETGLSFLEFNYMLLQAYDFHVLNKSLNCELQMGGQDQWGNIVAGVELVRKLNRQEVHGVTFPLLTDNQGRKFGKTAAGAVWLDPERTSVFDYYQFWRNCEDSDAGRLLALFTGLPVEETRRLGALRPPEINRAKEILAYEATALAHGIDEARATYLAAAAKFGFADPNGVIETSSAIGQIENKSGGDEDLPTVRLSKEDMSDDGIWIIKLLTMSGLCSSNGDARRLIKGGGAYFNDRRVDDPNTQLSRADIEQAPSILRAGKKKLRKIICESNSQKD